MRTILTLFFLFAVLIVSAQNYSELKRSAELAYHEKNYELSAKQYEAAFNIKEGSATDLYNAACSWALTGNKEKAFKMLDKAIGKGWINVTHTKQDPDLELLRNSSEWTRLITTMEEKLAEIEKDINKELKAELEMIKERDQRYRNEMNEVGTKYGWQSPEMNALWEKQSVLDSLNLVRVEQIINEFGYPGKKLVGQEQAVTTFLVIQHAPMEVQKKYLKILHEAAENGKLAKGNLAMLIDRINMREGKPQIYGSQLRQNPETGKMEFYEIEDEANVNKRRAEVGLPPIEEYAKMFGLEYQPPK